MQNKPITIPKRLQYLLLVVALLGASLLAVGLYRSQQRSNQNGHTSDCLAKSLRDGTSLNGPC